MRNQSLVLTALVGVCLFTPPLAAKYEETSVSGGGTVSGKVVYNGPVKTRTVLPTKDKDVCGGPRKQPVVVVGDGGAVKDSVVFLRDVTSGKAWPAGEQPKVDNVACEFEPHVQVARQGKIEIVNSDPVLHNTHGYYGTRTAFNVALPFEGASVTKLLRSAGDVRVDCDAHGWMLGWIYVVDNPYYAQTAEDGVFTITDVPPGDYTMVVWQEELGTTEIPVTVTAGQTTEVPVELQP